MEKDREEALRQRAYSIWENAGRPEGEHESHWQQALKELGLIDPIESQPKTVVKEKKPRATKSAASPRK